MSFCTAVNCMDGRVQDSVNKYLKKRFGVNYVDVISEAGPVRVLATEPDGMDAQAIYRCIGISTQKHASTNIAVVAHHDCAGNPLPGDEQLVNLHDSVELLKNRYPDVNVIGLWVDEAWDVSEVE